jgi:hypothetical protein
MNRYYLSETARARLAAESARIRRELAAKREARELIRRLTQRIGVIK